MSSLFTLAELHIIAAATSHLQNGDDKDLPTQANMDLQAKRVLETAKYYADLKKLLLAFLISVCCATRLPQVTTEMWLVQNVMYV